MNLLDIIRRFVWLLTLCRRSDRGPCWRRFREAVWLPAWSSTHRRQRHSWRTVVRLEHRSERRAAIAHFCRVAFRISGLRYHACFVGGVSRSTDTNSSIPPRVPRGQRLSRRRFQTPHSRNYAVEDLLWRDKGLRSSVATAFFHWEISRPQHPNFLAVSSFRIKKIH